MDVQAPQTPQSIDEKREFIEREAYKLSRLKGDIGNLTALDCSNVTVFTKGPSRQIEDICEHWGATLAIEVYKQTALALLTKQADDLQKSIDQYIK